MNFILPSYHFRSLPRNIYGVSLIEMMVSLTIGLLIIGGIGYAYLGSRQVFRSQDALSRMQESARTAFEIMGRDIRMVGFTGCPRNTSASGDINILTKASDWDKNLYGQPLIGYENTSGLWNTFPLGVTGVMGNVLRGDVITVLHADNSKEFIVSSHDTVDSKFTLTANHDLRQGDVLVVIKPDCSRTAIFQNTKACTINSAGNCGHKIVEHTSNSPCATGNGRKGLGSPIGLCPEGTRDTFGVTSRIFKLTAVTYYIGTNAANEPSLYRQILGVSSNGTPTNTAEELIEGVQEMQLSYGIDTSADSFIDKVDEYRTANNVTDWSRVLGIRISLLMVSRQDEQGITTLPQQYVLDRNGDGDVSDTGETVMPADHLLRKAFTTTIEVKNRS
jgi:type IV pilus assembly protein PilW